MKDLRNYISIKRITLFSALIVVLFISEGCGESEVFNEVENIQDIIAPLPEYTPVPENNPQTAEKINLGKQLFWDPILSGNKDVACATCHHPEKGYADALDLSIGVNGIGLGEQRRGIVLAKRNANTIINTAYNGIKNDDSYTPQSAPMFWDNRAMSLEEQALLPLLSKEEMRGTAIPENILYDSIINRLNQIEEYKLAFKNVFGEESISMEKVAQAIASFERTIIANNSPFDRYIRGDVNAMNQQQINGMNAFINVGCAECHSGPMFSDFELHTIGVPDNPKLPSTDSGVNTYTFRTPSLRNLPLTAPYMHNGMHASLQEVMNFYEDVAEGDTDDINVHISINDIDPLARQLEMDNDVIDEIIAFIEALDDNNFDKSIPASVPSGLPVGGNIHN
ncbi:cytochrome-c peroxidase [Tenacibaculum xiamenense]|uniref:cytochrome-c peroxidase n=1 Tax=Tenacibaculum xiamenense TaxID=1261553 RepID=UPI0038947263